MTAVLDRLTWHAHVRVEKYNEEDGEFTPGESIPYEVIERDGNILVNSGIGLLEDLLIGAGGTAFTNAVSAIGVGDSNTAAAAGQTDLQAATNKTRKPMDATFPSRSSQTITFKATFGTSDANYAWLEWGIFNNTSGGTMLNRKQENLGTKATGTWVITATITIS